MIYWITKFNDCEIGFGSCPIETELISQIIGYKNLGIDLVVSLLEEEEVTYLKLGEEEQLIHDNEMLFLNFPIRDMGIPTLVKFSKWIEEIYLLKFKMQKIYIHCRHGIGRSSLLTAGLMIRGGLNVNEVLHLIEMKRGMKIPETLSQRKLLGAYSLQFSCS